MSQDLMDKIIRLSQKLVKAERKAVQYRTMMTCEKVLHREFSKALDCLHESLMYQKQAHHKASIKSEEVRVLGGREVDDLERKLQVECNKLQQNLTVVKRVENLMNETEYREYTKEIEEDFRIKQKEEKENGTDKPREERT